MTTDRPPRWTTPQDRLTRICDAMTTVFNDHPEHEEGDRCIVFLDGEGMGGLVLEGYDDDMEAFVNLFMHLRAIFRANGKDLEFVAIPDDISGVDDAD